MGREKERRWSINPTDNPLVPEITLRIPVSQPWDICQISSAMLDLDRRDNVIAEWSDLLRRKHTPPTLGPINKPDSRLRECKMRRGEYKKVLSFAVFPKAAFSSDHLYHFPFPKYNTTKERIHCYYSSTSSSSSTKMPSAQKSSISNPQPARTAKPSAKKPSCSNPQPAHTRENPLQGMLERFPSPPHKDGTPDKEPILAKQRREAREAQQAQFKGSGT